MVGTVVNNEGDSDTFAFATVIPMNRHQVRKRIKHTMNTKSTINYTQ